MIDAEIIQKNVDLLSLRSLELIVILIILAYIWAAILFGLWDLSFALYGRIFKSNNKK